MPAKGAPEGQQQGGGDNSLDLLWTMGLIIAAILLTWYFGKIHIIKGVFIVRSYEVGVIKSVIAYWNKFIHLLGLPTVDLTNLDQWTKYMRANYGAEVEFSIVSLLSATVGKYLAYPACLILIILAAFLYFGSISQKFKTIFDMKKLEIVSQKEWPQITPVLKLDLVNEKVDEGSWAMSLSPMPFCKKNNLLDVEYKEGKYFATVKKGAAHRLFSLQLGPRWYGYEALPIHLKALFAVFAARLDSDKKSADILLDQIAVSSAGSKLNFEGAESLMRKHGNVKTVQKVVQMHGYVTTALASLLSASREAGVLSTSEFLWLKKVDRRMWYMLNSVGRHTAVPEIAGAFSHWLAEKKLGLPLRVPMVEEAVRGMEIAISEIIYKPDEE
jgi:intracellular multiplication protein IcmP